MSKKYRLIYETPQGNCSVEADNRSEFETMIPRRVDEMLAIPKRLRAMGLNEAAATILEIYGRQYCHRVHSSVTKAGAELDLIKCYLQGITIKEIVKWLRANKQVSLSKSAVGRYCARIFRLCMIPRGLFQKRMLPTGNKR